MYKLIAVLNDTYNRIHHHLMKTSSKCLTQYQSEYFDTGN